MAPALALSFNYYIIGNVSI